MKVKNQINSAIISAVVAMLNPFVTDLTPANLIAALQKYDSSAATDERPQKPYTVSEAARLLKVSRPTLYRLFEDGILTKLKIRNATRIPASEVNRLMVGGKEDN